ncbi:MAG: hypothetical protein ACFFE2_01610 [Candidatus Thorarchaeota archaeon]
MGFLGTTAPLLVDVNLILQYLTLILLIVGYVKRKPLKTHGYIMLLVLLIGILTTFAVMAPSLLPTAAIFGVAVFGHAAAGTIAMLLGVLFTYRFVIALRNEQPLSCGKKRNMRIALILWIVLVLFGTMIYLSLYL